MKQNFLRSIPVLCALVGLGVFEFAKWCEGAHCSVAGNVWEVFDGLILPLYWFSLITLAPLVLIALLSHRVFKFWLRFAIPAIIIALILIALTPASSSGLFSPFGPERYFIAKVTAWAFDAGTVVMIIWGLLRKKSGAR